MDSAKLADIAQSSTQLAMDSLQPSWSKTNACWLQHDLVSTTTGRAGPLVVLLPPLILLTRVSKSVANSVCKFIVVGHLEVMPASVLQ